MKYLYTLCLVSATIILFSACNERKPEVSDIIIDNTSITPNPKKVLIEGFTGVWCINCPEGNEVIQDLLSLHEERLVVVSIHTGVFSPPLPSSNYDFRTTDGDQLSDLLGSPAGYPSGVINRRKFGSSTMQQMREKWSGFVAEELAGNAKVNLDIVKTYDSASRALSLTVKLIPNESLEGNFNYTVLITESGMVDLQQDDDDGLIPDYVHKHVLRDILTNAGGDPITDDLTEGNVIEKELTYILPEEWVAEDCSIIAHVSRSGATKEVLQVEESKITN